MLTSRGIGITILLAAIAIANEARSGLIIKSSPLTLRVVDGTKVNPRLSGLSPNTAIDLGLIDCATPDGEGDGACRKITDYSSFVYDSKRHQFLMFGGGHATTFTDVVLRFNLSTLKWEDLYEPTPCSLMTLSNLDKTLGAWKSVPGGPAPRPFSTHTYDMLGVLGDEFVMAATGTGRMTSGTCSEIDNDSLNGVGKIAFYNLTTGVWRFSKADRFYQGFPGMELDPLSNKFIAFGRDRGLEVYDPATDTTTNPLPNAGDSLMGIEGNLVYFPPKDAFYYMAGSYQPSTLVWEIKLNRSDFAKSQIRQLSPTGSASPNKRGFAYDNKNQIIGGGISGNRFYAFDPVANSWSSLAIATGNPNESSFHALGYDPINNVYIFINENGYYDRKTWAYRYK